MTTQAICRWLSNILSEAGIHKCFRAHSTRSSAAGKAAKSLEINAILKTVGWSREATFAKTLPKQHHRLKKELHKCYIISVTMPSQICYKSGLTLFF